MGKLGIAMVGGCVYNRSMNLADVTFTPHFIRQAVAKGFTAEDIADAIERPYKVTPVTKHPGQLRYCGSLLAVVMDGTRAVTVYLDGVVTPLRPDQTNDPAALASKRLFG